MKVSLNWAQYDAAVQIVPDDISSLLQKIGAQLGAIEEVIDYRPRYEGIVVAKVVACDKHPGADRLNVCLIDDGGVVTDVERNADGLVQVVCGAPNVRSGLTVAWLPPGTTVPASYDEAEPFMLAARPIRGIVSNGMLASPKELAMSDDHEGILEINAEDVGEDNCQPGTPFSQLYGVSDVVVDCENKMFTHRPDCFGILGVARELAGIQHVAYTSPEWWLQPSQIAAGSSLPLSVAVEDELMVPRFMAVAMENVTVKPSPYWLQAGLHRTGYRAINNIVDLTNYCMHLTGQPIHAYDYDKVKAVSKGEPKLIVRAAVAGETIRLLNGKMVTLEAGTTVIATDTAVVGIAGVMGGADTEVDASTKRIIIEVGTFDMYAIRRTSMQYGLFTDAVTRFNKGQSPLQNDRVLAKMVAEVTAQAGGAVASPVLDERAATVVEKIPVAVSVAFINQRLGSDLTAKDIQTLLQNVEIITTYKDDTLTIQPPFWRRDLILPEDIVEEVGRLYGFDRLPITMPQRPSRATRKDPSLAFASKVRHTLAALGANELLTYSFVHQNLFKKVGQDAGQAFHIRNAISPELQYYRLSLLPSLLDKVHANIKADTSGTMAHKHFALFEINKVHSKNIQDTAEPNIPAEHQHIALVVAADAKTASYHGDVAYYWAAAYVHELLTRLHIPFHLEPITDQEASDPMRAPFASPRTAAVIVGGTLVGYVGEFTTAVESAFKLPAMVAGFELNMAMLRTAQAVRPYQVMPVYPKTEQDITVSVAADLPYRKLQLAFVDALQQAAPRTEMFSQFVLLDIYQADPATVRYTFRLWLARHDRTMQTSEATAIVDAVAVKLKQHCKAERIV